MLRYRMYLMFPQWKKPSREHKCWLRLVYSSPLLLWFLDISAKIAFIYFVYTCFVVDSASHTLIKLLLNFINRYCANISPPV